MHHGYGTYCELENAMRRACHDRFHRDLGIKRELVDRVEHKKIKLDDEKKPMNNDNGSIDVD